VSATDATFATAPYGHARVDDATWVKLVIHEGRKRQVRLMCAKLGHPVLELVRTRVGEVRLGRLQAGQVRSLSDRELRSLLRAVGLRRAENQPVHSRR
jgi:23S rRNA pseudouridine2605 synthase